MTQDTRTAAAFMAMGLSYPNNDAFNKLLEHWDHGCLEIIQAVTAYAPYADALAVAGFAATGDYPGVYDYEVSEAFGTWFAGQIMALPPGQLPDASDCTACLRQLAAVFFINADVSHHGLAKALADVPT